jgi:hypothetical protein
MHLLFVNYGRHLYTTKYFVDILKFGNIPHTLLNSIKNVYTNILIKFNTKLTELAEVNKGVGKG